MSILAFARRVLAAFAVAGLAATGAARAQAADPPPAWGGLHVKGQKIVDAAGAEFISKGFGIGEWTNTEAYMLEWPDGDGKYRWYYGYTRIHDTLDTLMGPTSAAQYWQAWNANVVGADDFARLRGWGVNTLRISINHHWLSPADGVYLDSGWAWLDQMIAWAKANGIYVVLCMHAAPGGQSPELMSDTVDGKAHLWTQPAIYQPWTTHLWTAIAQRYANETAVAGYDLLDEPLLSESKPASGGATVRAFYVQLTAAIRAVDTHHILFACGTDWCGSTAGMKAILPTWDDNMVLVFHKYWDKNNTASIQGYLDIRSKHDVPLWNGETGESDAAWASGMVDLMAANGIGWSWWTYKKVNQDNQPCSIPEPPNYGKILAYVGGTGAQPSQQASTTIMMQLAANAATSACVWDDAFTQALFGVDH
jgi:endoglucanase